MLFEATEIVQWPLAHERRIRHHAAVPFRAIGQNPTAGPTSAGAIGATGG
jgi:hypothetical protein